MSSGFPFPLPWYCILANTYLIFRLFCSFAFASRLRMLDRYRKEHGVTGLLPLLRPYTDDAHFLCPALPQIDFPIVIPTNITPCGPILLAVDPVSESDPGLAAWLGR